MKINIIHFDPVIGGETTLCNALSSILSAKHDVKVIHPVHLNKKGLPKIDKGWATVIGGVHLGYDDVEKICSEADVIFCINAKHVKGSVKSDKRAIAQADSDNFFGRFHNKSFIFYEHGIQTWRLYNYEKLFANLLEQGNEIRVMTNTNEAIDFYAAKGYNSHLCRQPFFPGFYPEVEKNQSETVNICFNSRYSSNKGPHMALPYFEKFLGKGLNFRFNFRGNLSDPVSIWHNLKHYFNDHEEIVMGDPTSDRRVIYGGQDYTVWCGHTAKAEHGKLEYSPLESIYYGIPIIAHSQVIDCFKHHEYGTTPEQIQKAFIRLSEENLEKIINKEFDSSEYVKNARKLLEDFLPSVILERFEKCISSPPSKGRKLTKLF
jgi:hypothetical protein